MAIVTRCVKEIATGDMDTIFLTQMENLIVRFGSKKMELGQRLKNEQKTRKRDLYSTFFDVNRVVALIPVKKGKSVTSRVYTAEILPEVQGHYTKHRPKTGMLGINFLHYNASACT